jgi:hypothetical protein
MMSESGYYFTHLISAVEFIKTVDQSGLSITKEEWDRYMSVPPAFDIKSPVVLSRSNSSTLISAEVCVNVFFFFFFFPPLLLHWHWVFIVLDAPRQIPSIRSRGPPT